MYVFLYCIMYISTYVFIFRYTSSEDESEGEGRFLQKVNER